MQDWHGTWKKRTFDLKSDRFKIRRWLQDQTLRTKLIRNAAILFAASVVIGTLCFVTVFAWFAKDLPQPDKIVRRDGYSTKILDRRGELLYEVFVDQQRTPATMEQIPDDLKKAVIAVEDKNFYKHGGFDRQGYLRIVWNIFTRRRLIGGSTLTQQLVKNVLLTKERSVVRKLKELILAVQIENRYNKDQILLMYLNENPYGGTIWGVATAAQVYFHKPLNELNLVESAILAGLPQRPSYYSPLASKDKQAYKGRTKDVLRRMREDNYISKEQETQALQELEAMEIKPALTSIKAPHFTMYVKEQLEEMFGQGMVEQGGLRVYTTLDYELQQKAQQAVTEEIEKVAAQGIGNGASMVMDPKTGEILAMVGSKDYFAKDYDGQVNVTLSERQPGSTIKPVTYAVAFAKGMSPSSLIMDVPTQFPGASPEEPYEPKNYDGKFRGAVNLRSALGSSLNIPAVKLLGMVGIDNMLQQAYDMGISTLEPTKDNMKRFGLAVTLGGGEVRLIDMVSAYSSFANGGTRVEPVSILKVEDRSGKTLHEHKQVQGKRLMDEGVAFLINHVLSDNNARLMTFGANSYLNMGGRPVAVKTGTTNDRRDNWTIGWSNTAIVGVWVGNNDNSPMKQVTSGVSGAAPIWRKIILEALNKYPANDWNIPSNVEVVTVDDISGYPEHDGFPVRRDYAIKGTIPPLPDPIHRKIKLCRGQDKLATQLDIERNEYEEKEFITPLEEITLGKLPSWKEQIQTWASSQGDARFRAPTDYCTTSDDVAVGIEDPGDKKNYGENDEIPVGVRVVTNGEVDKVDIFVDGKLALTLADLPYRTTLTSLSKGKHTIKAKAYRKDGKTGETGERQFGVGDVKWDEPSPAPSPTPNN